ncbi:MAG: PhoH family protein [Spirochaetia bacterium]
MDNTLSIILHDHEILTRICGEQDKNLRIIEEILDSQIFIRGNEMHLDSQEPGKQALFRELLKNLEEHVKNGHEPSPALIRSIVETIESGDTNKTEFLKAHHISIPGTSTKIFPKSFHQAKYIQAMQYKDAVFCIGPAGTGKTYIAIAHALHELLSKNKRKIILTRPVVEAGESLGFLPGDLTQKLSPYLRPLYDAMEHLLPFELINRLDETRSIEVAPLAYMRGRSLNDAIIILDEGQNTTIEQMKMFLTRIGEGSKAVITGDITQIDLPKGKQSGLIHALHILQSIEEISILQFDKHDVVRNPIVKKIIAAYETKKEW